MAAYLVVTLTVSDAAAFDRYRTAIAGLEAQWGGRYIARAPVLDRLEGTATAGENVALMEFPDADAARAFIGSEAYQAAKQLRAGAAVLDMRLVEGL
jgi:uncharacterized protein (DUF1330 family)